MYGLAALTVGISSIPLLFILWRVVKAPIWIWVPLLFFLGLIVKRFKELSYEELIELENNGTIYRAVRHRPR
jgi:hypothetical protein